MDLRNFILNTKFSYIQPYDDIPDKWNIINSLNNHQFPEQDIKLRGLLRFISQKYPNGDYSFPLAGMLNKAVRDMDDDYCFAFFGTKGPYMTAGLLGNISKKALIVSPSIKKSIIKRGLFPHLKSCHKIISVSPTHYVNTHNDTIGKIGVLFVDGNNANGAIAALHKKIIAPDCVVFFTGINNDQIYDKAIKFFIASSPPFTPDTLLFQKTNATNNHPTYWDGVFILRLL